MTDKRFREDAEFYERRAEIKISKGENSGSIAVTFARAGQTWEQAGNLPKALNCYRRADFHAAGSSLPDRIYRDKLNSLRAQLGMAPEDPEVNARTPISGWAA